MKTSSKKACVAPAMECAPSSFVIQTSWDHLDYYSKVLTSLEAKQEKENTMFTETETQRNYLDSRLRTVYGNKNAEARKSFNIERFFPDTAQEAFDLIKAGKYKINQKQIDEYKDDTGEDMAFDRYDFTYLIDWDLGPADKAGYKTFSEKLEKAYQDARDQIKVLPVEKGLEALKAFESATFH